MISAGENVTNNGEGIRLIPTPSTEFQPIFVSSEAGHYEEFLGDCSCPPCEQAFRRRVVGPGLLAMTSREYYQQPTNSPNRDIFRMDPEHGAAGVGLLPLLGAGTVDVSRPQLIQEVVFLRAYSFERQAVYLFNQMIGETELVVKNGDINPAAVEIARGVINQVRTHNGDAMYESWATYFSGREFVDNTDMPVRQFVQGLREGVTQERLSIRIGVDGYDAPEFTPDIYRRAMAREVSYRSRIDISGRGHLIVVQDAIREVPTRLDSEQLDSLLSMRSRLRAQIFADEIDRMAATEIRGGVSVRGVWISDLTIRAVGEVRAMLGEQFYEAWIAATSRSAKGAGHNTVMGGEVEVARMTFLESAAESVRAGEGEMAFVDGASQRSAIRVGGVSMMARFPQKSPDRVAVGPDWLRGLRSLRRITERSEGGNGIGGGGTAVLLIIGGATFIGGSLWISNRINAEQDRLITIPEY